MLGAALFVAGLLQFSDIAIFGVVPNFVLVVIVVAALLLRDLWYLLFLLSVAAFFLKFSPSAELEIVTFFLIGACATTALYAFVDRVAISSLMFALELGYNMVLTYALYHGLMAFRLFRHR